MEMSSIRRGLIAFDYNFLGHPIDKCYKTRSRNASGSNTINQIYDSFNG